MRQSNTYILTFSAILTVILGGLLALAAVGLGPIQKEQVAIDTRKKILSAVMDISEIPAPEIPALYDKRIQSLVVNRAGEVVETDAEGNQLVAENVEVAKEFKKDPDNRLYPVFKFMSSEKPEEVDAYIIPIYGNGLWDNIWGYIALEKDLATLRGVVFDHKGETPGLGARITSLDVQERFEGKKIYDDVGELVAVEMMKGETGDPSIYSDNEVDGLSGATITAKGVNNMLKNYLGYYQEYFEKLNEGSDMAKAVNM